MISSRGLVYQLLHECRIGAVALAPPDGYTLLFTSAALNMVAAMGTQTSYKVPDSFTPVVNVIWTPLILLAHPSLGVKTAQELIELAKSKRGQLIYATAGQGSPSHFATELFRVRSGFEATGVPYRGSPQALFDVIAGRAAFLFTPASTALPQVRAGKQRHRPRDCEPAPSTAPTSRLHTSPVSSSIPTAGK